MPNGRLELSAALNFLRPNIQRMECTDLMVPTQEVHAQQGLLPQPDGPQHGLDDQRLHEAELKVEEASDGDTHADLLQVFPQFGDIVLLDGHLDQLGQGRLQCLVLWRQCRNHK